MKHGKKYAKSALGREKGKQYSLNEAVSFVKQATFAKFDETIDMNINVGIDPSKGDQIVRGSVVLPHGSGKKVRVIVFAKADHAKAAQEAGADVVGMEDLIDRIAGGWMDFEYAVATPDVMGQVGKLAKQLGPRGLLPNKKVGTVTFDVAQIVNELKGGRVFFKNDKNAIVHFSVGKVSFDESKIQDNVKAFVKTLAASKPAASKGKFIQKVTLSSTMGPGLALAVDELVK